MAFLTAVASSRFPLTHNQLRTSSNSRNQAIIQDNRVTMQQVQGRQGQSYAGNGYKGNAMSFRGNNAGGQARVVKSLGYQNLFYLKKAQRIKLTLYDGSVISSQHVASPVIDDEETLILEELNRLSEDFDKHFVPQQELSNEQAFWLQTSRPNTDQSALSPVKIKAPKELPKESLVNTSLKKLKYHLGQFDAVVKKRITSDAIIEGEWGFEHMKTIFLNEIIPFLRPLKVLFNVLINDLLNECFEIHKKELFLENDRLLQKIMSQDVMIFVMNSTAVFDDVNVELQSSQSCVKCLDLDAELLKS
ncbi:hypothetical protein Tco_1554171 [Tanacetum coccineum]